MRYQAQCPNCSYQSEVSTDFQETLLKVRTHFDNSIHAEIQQGYEIEVVKCPSVKLVELK